MDNFRFQQIITAVHITHPHLLPTRALELELGLDELTLGDPPATSEEVAAAENDLGVKFPDEYKFFLREHGGGGFGYEDIYSVRPGSSWDIRTGQPLDSRPLEFLAVSPNGCGDYYGFRVNNGVCESRVSFMDHEEGSAICPTEYRDILEYVVGCALKENIDKG